MNIIKKIKAIDKLQEQIDGHIWNIFNRYIEIKKINFSSPDDWKIEDDTIYFHGSDGCMGCYDRMSIYIPLKYFENPDEEFELLEKEVKKDLSKEKSRKKQEVKRKDIALLKKLNLLGVVLFGCFFVLLWFLVMSI